MLDSSVWVMSIHATGSRGWHTQDSNKIHSLAAQQPLLSHTKGKKKKKKASGKNAIQTIRVYFSSLLFPCYSFLLIRESAMYKDGWKKRILNSVYKIFLLLLFCAISDFLQPMHTSIVTLAYYLQVFSHPYSALKLYCVWLWPFQPLLKQWLR